jgi:hypothetical protein
MQIINTKSNHHKKHLSKQPLTDLALHTSGNGKCLSVIVLWCQKQEKLFDTLFFKREVEGQEKISNKVNESLKQVHCR